MSHQQARRFEAQITKRVRLNYLLYLPTDYKSETKQRWPMIMFLHGLGERGDDVELLKVHGIPKILETRREFPFIAVSPQCPGESWWPQEVDALKALVDYVADHYAVDQKRIYLTGLSMGGFGTWSLGIAYPERFAAIAPICGGGVPPLAGALKDVPTWAFHGALDDVVPLKASEDMVNVLRESGGDVKLTIYPDLGHDSWTVTYDNPELYTWFLQHQRK
jgi:predicted peptidase